MSKTALTRSGWHERTGATDTYPRPPHGWTCFHCGETFKTPGSARDHFGAAPDAEPGCAIKVRLGAERGLLHALRQAEDDLAQWQTESTDLHRWAVSAQGRHAEALRTAEEAGYERGLRDARAEGAEQVRRQHPGYCQPAGDSQ